MTGFEAVAKIRANPTLAGIPVIAVSASILENEQKQSLRVGCNDFLSKPFETNKVLEVLQYYLKLEWRYDTVDSETGESATAQSLEPAAEFVLPPQEELKVLYELAQLGNMERLMERARYLQDLSEDYRPFAEKIYQLAENFDDVQIQALVTKYLAENQLV
jgi:CheY-like chemotaxis protein